MTRLRGGGSTYDDVVSEITDAHDSISDLAKQVPDDADPPRWLTGKIESESVVCFEIRPLPGEDASPVVIAFDLGAVVKAERGV